MKDPKAWVDRKAGHRVQTMYPADGAFAIPAPTAVKKRFDEIYQ